MLRRTLFHLACLSTLLGVTLCNGQQDEVPSFKGFVTGVSTPTSFDVNGFHITTTPDTLIGNRMTAERASQQSTAAVPRVGQSAEIFGQIDRKKHTIVAVKISLQEPRIRDVDGEGAVESVDSAKNGNLDDHLIRVDGYNVLVTAGTVRTDQLPATRNAPIKPNMWMTFHGQQRLDGIVVASRLTMDDNGISNREEKLLKKSDYDPAAVDKNSKQGALSKAVRGIDPKKIPPYDDPAMQARVEAIGEKLVPKSQRSLPADDDRKIDFQFQVIDLNKWRKDAHTLPNGIILVPKQVVERMQNDAQLATVLADNIACALEKQAYRDQPGAASRGAVAIAGDAAGLFVPGLSLLTGGGASLAASKALRHREEQSGRVSLFLLNDAGYDIQQAPIAWWLLASKKPKDVADISMPHRAAYLYETIFHTWPQP